MKFPYYRKLAFILTLLTVSFHSFAQFHTYTCTTHSMSDALLANSEEARATREQFLREVAEYDGSRAGLKVIPTVVHIIHNYGSENLPKQTVLDAIEVVNQELKAENSGLNSVVSAFQSIIGDAEFELRLAKIDPSGKCTDGITRTASSLTTDADENVKSLINWNTGTRKYLQVWLVLSLGNGAGGYTYLPGMSDAQHNGIIIRAGQFQQSLTHEFGHWMNLAHTWGGSNTPGNSSNCYDDDGISDTPNTVGTTSCNTSQQSCGSLDNVQNFMDYSGCERMFTLQQASAMQAAANSSIGGRSQYWSNSNLTATGTNDGYVSNSCTPTVDFTLNNSQGCEGFAVEFSDHSWGADEDASWEWSWSFPGGTPSSSTDREPTITYNNAGTYNVSLTITTSAGSQTHTITNAVSVDVASNGYQGPVFEGLEASSFPTNPSGLNWSIPSAGNLNWQRTTTASYTGEGSARINLRNITTGDVRDLISPAIDLSNVGSSDATMTFKLAHANRNSTSHSERLRVLVSDDCGQTWKVRYNKSGNNLNTAGGNVSSTFVPADENDWREETVSLAIVAGSPRVYIKFEATSDQQSYLYIDDINITPNAPMGIEENDAITEARIYPNPINGTSQLEVVLKEATHASFSIVNMVGQQLAVIDRKLPAGATRIALDSYTANLNTGVYLLHIRTDKGTDTIRFVKN